jgi:copper chaperone
MSTTTDYSVAGMTCNHCVHAVREEVSKVDGVTEVKIDLASGGPSTIQITSQQDLSVDQVREAVDEAGYDLVDSTP